MKKIYSILALISIVVVITFYFSKDDVFISGLLLSLLGALLSVIIALLVINSYLENKKDKEWAEVKVEVLNQLRSELSGVFYDIIFLSDQPGIGYWPESDSKVNVNELYHAKLHSMSSLDKINIPERVIGWFREGSFQNLFGIRNMNLNWIELKYSKYFKPGVVKSLIIIQRALSKIDLNLKMFGKRKIDEKVLLNDFQILYAMVIKEIKKIDDAVDLFN